MAAQNPTVRILRKLCGLSQAELAQIIDCARLTIHSLEAGKLKLSNKMAEKIALHTGVSPAWLLANNAKGPPVCQHDSERPYTKEVFKMRRAEILASRTAPVDLFAVSKYVEDFCGRLRGCAEAAYRSDEIIYFYYTVREFLDPVERRWNINGQSGLTQNEFWQSLEKDSAAKKTRKRHQPS